MPEGADRYSRQALAAFLGVARKAAKLTQQAAGEALGVDRSQISRWESGENVPREERVDAIAALYKIDETDLAHRVLAAGEEERLDLRKDNDGLRQDLQRAIKKLDEGTASWAGVTAEMSNMMPLLKALLERVDPPGS